MNIDFYYLKWSELSRLSNQESLMDTILYFNDKGEVASNYDWIEDISQSVEISLQDLQRRDEAYICFNYNREAIKKHFSINIYHKISFIIEGIIGQENYDEDIFFEDYPKELEEIEIRPYFIAFSPIKIRKIIDAWEEFDYMNEISKVYNQPSSLCLNKIEIFLQFSNYIKSWVYLLKQINKKNEWGLLLNW